MVPLRQGNDELELAFSTKALRDICENEVLAYQVLDADIAKVLISRLADLRAVETLSQIPIGNPIRTTYNGEDCMEIEIARGAMILFCANHTNNPRDSNYDINWGEVKRIKIYQIGEFNG